MLEIKNLHAAIEGREIRRGITLAVNAGEVHAIMGPNGSGKSTLAQVLAGRDGHAVTGEVRYDGKDLLAILDETDSGLDIDALRIVASGVNALRSKDRAMLVITHYQRLLDYIVPDHDHVLANGRIVRSGGKDLAIELEKHGYAGIEPQAAPAPLGNAP